jgi:2'-5' RNA ligase
MAMPPRAVLDAMHVIVDRYGLAKQLNGALFVPTNWHQSLSDRHWEEDTPDLREKMLRAGTRVSAQSVAMVLNRVVANGEHWFFRARGSPDGFPELLDAIRGALAAEGIEDGMGHTPHVTLSYTAAEHQKPPKIKEVIEWTLDELLLVVGGGSPYRYEVLGRWPLQPLAGGRQLDLF